MCMTNEAAAIKLAERDNLVGELVGALELLTVKRHMFSPTEFGGYVCRHCGGYPTDAPHFRIGEDANTDLAKARAVLAKAREGAQS
ncbi:hypothetical protein GO299_04709 [Ralstonia solanacearum]|nr:hypothetical protein [Ralstonia solanacearum]NKF72422.1 hypothetical protein [Ralstonia solanacearum]